MNAEVISVGTELLLGQIVDTHAPRMARILAECGIGCQRRSTIGDNMDRLVAAIRESLSRCDVVVTIGGLGPTLDDLTRNAIAEALDDSLENVPEVAEQLKAFFDRRGIRWSESILRQAEKPTCARLIDNPHGTAPGLICEKNGKRVVALPGPKGEFNPMADGPVRLYLGSLTEGQVIHSRVLRICGIGESHVEDLVRPFMNSENPTVAPYAHPAEVQLRVTAKATSLAAAEAIIQPVVDDLSSILGEYLFGFDDTPLEEAVLAELVLRESTVAVAESMTGGGLAERITAVPGASKAFLGGAIVYTGLMKQDLLGVRAETISTYGAVSGECAREMAEGARSRFRSTYAVSVTGNAGPTAEVGDAPVGVTFIGVAGPGGASVERIQSRGLREDIRRRATQVALVNLRRAIRQS